MRNKPAKNQCKNLAETALYLSPMDALFSQKKNQTTAEINKQTQTQKRNSGNDKQVQQKITFYRRYRDDWVIIFCKKGFDFLGKKNFTQRNPNPLPPRCHVCKKRQTSFMSKVRL